MEQAEETFNVFETLDGIKENLIYFSRCPDKTYFKNHNGKILVSSEKTRFVISYDDFLSLYKKQVFFVYDSSSSEGIDEEKDREYYSWTHK